MEAHESTRQCLESSLPKDHEDDIAGKGYNSMTHPNSVHKFIPVPQAMKIPDAKAAVDREWQKLETIPAWQLKKLRAKAGDIGSTKRQLESPLSLMDGHLSSQKCGVRAQITEVLERQSRALGDTVKDDSGVYAY